MTRTLAVTLLLLIAALPVSAQLPADATWRTMETTNFRVTYHEGLEDLARHAGASAERARAALSLLVADAPRGMIDIVVTDHLDITNAWATPLPSNRIAVFARAPVDMVELQYTRDWIEIAVVHELAHIFHLDASAGLGRAGRRLFGRAPVPWPMFSVALSPLWMVEGLAVSVESTLTSFGRVHGSYHEMVVRTAALESEVDDLNLLGSGASAWPGPMRAYIYGSLFMDYLARRYGHDAAARIVQASAKSALPPLLNTNRVARAALGVTFREAYRDWTAELNTRYADLQARLSAEGITESQRLTTHGRYALYARFSPDGGRIAYGRADGRSESSVTVIDAQTGAVEWTSRGPGVQPLAWLADGTVITSALQHADRHHILNDLYTAGPDGRTRVTRNARLHQPDATTGGRIVAVESSGGTNRLVLLDMQTGSRRPLTQFDADVQWSLPRWSPDGSRIAVTRWQTGGRHDVVVVDTTGVVRVVVSDGSGVNTAAAWTPDGEWLLFTSDRTGISNLYAAELRGTAASPYVSAIAGSHVLPPAPRLYQVTNVLSGAFHPDVSPDGSTIIFSQYRHDGYSIERMRFDPSSWREPQPLAAPAPAQRPSYGDATDRDRFADSLRVVMAAADTSIVSERAYRATQHMRPHYWLPVIADAAGSTFVGISSSGADLVDRHAWAARLAVAPSTGRTTGRFAYAYRGLPTLPALRAHPTLGLEVRSDWERLVHDSVAGFHVDRREDRAELSLGLEHVRIRTTAGGSVGGELVRRRAETVGLPQDVPAEPWQDLYGITTKYWLASYVRPALSIGPQDGVSLQLSARQRWDRQGADAPRDGGGYREATSWNAAYVSLPLPGFSRHVLAVRGSMLFRDGPGAAAAGIGDVGGDDADDDVEDGQTAGSSRLLPVRGFAAGARRGTRAWTASVEYRFPLAVVTRPLAPLPFFLDRVGGTLFVDAGHAWCGAGEPQRPVSACSATTAAASPLIGAGGELVSYISMLGFGTPVRFGAGVPIAGSASRSPRFYIATGLAF